MQENSRQQGISGRQPRGSGRQAAAGLFLFLSILLPARAFSQVSKLRDDPVLGPVMTACDAGSYAEAETLLKAAIRDAEAQNLPDRRLRVLLSRLAEVELNTGHAADSVDIGMRLLADDEKAFGLDSRNVLADLAILGRYYFRAGDDDAAGHTYERELAVARNGGWDTLLPLVQLAHYCDFKERRAEAEALFIEALESCDTPNVGMASVCSDARGTLAKLYRKEGNLSRAQEVISIGAAQAPNAGTDWSTQVQNLDTLARQYEEDHAYKLAEARYRQAIAVIEKAKKLVDKSEYEAGQMVHIGQLFEKDGRPDEAEEIYRNALSSAESSVTAEHPNNARSLLFYLEPLNGLYQKEGRLNELELIIRQALTLQEKALGPQHEKVMSTTLVLAHVCEAEEKYSEAEQLFQRAQDIDEKDFGPDNHMLPDFLSQYADLLRRSNQPEKAEAVAKRAAALREKIKQQMQGITQRN